MKRRWLLIAGALLLVALSGFVVATIVTDDDEGDERPVARARFPPLEEAPAGRERGPRVSGRVRALAREMPLARRVAQLFLVGFDGTDATAPVFGSFPERVWGAVVIGPDNVPFPEVLGALSSQFAAVSATAGVTPPLVVGDELSTFPVQPGVRSASRARADAQAAATSLAAAGVDAVLAPQADIAVPAGPAAETGFADEPVVVGRVARAAVKGWLAGGVLPAVGHFPGQGAASQDPLQGPSIVGAEPEVDAFEPALRKAPAVVVSNAAYATFDSVTPASLLPELVDGLLREELGFGGVAITDELGGATAATGGTTGAAAVDALRAGIDLVQVRDPAEADAAYAAVLRAARSGDLPGPRLREALLRVLALKERAGLL